MSGDARPVGATAATIAARLAGTARTDHEPGEDEGAPGLALRDHREDVWRRWCPQRFHLATLEWIAAEHGGDTLGALCDWAAQRPRPNLVLLGPVGTGKTGAALSICRRDWLEAGMACRFLPTVELLDGLRPDGGLDFDDLATVPRLIVDDLGAERPTEWTAERLYALVNRRWLEEMPIVATSNLEAGDLAEAVGERVWSRLVGDDAVVLHLGGDDRRRRR